MSKASKSSASEHTQLEGYEGHFEDFGPYTVGFETYTADAELAPLFAGLPDDHCGSSGRAACTAENACLASSLPAWTETCGYAKWPTGRVLLLPAGSPPTIGR